MRVLVACEESQAVTKEFRRLGHEAYSCDIQECSGGHPEWHIKGDVLPLIDGNCEFATMDGEMHLIDSEWDILIAHPPCTYLAKSGACRLYKTAGTIDPERMKSAMEARLFFQRFLDAKCRRVAIENPTPLKVMCLPKPTQIIQPYQFGHPYSKRTCLWINGLPNLEPTNVVETYTPYLPSNTGGYARGGEADIAGKRMMQKLQAKPFRASPEQWRSNGAALINKRTRNQRKEE